ncbi:MAG: DNA replication/repair protein RecF [Oscillospiraceae bacterium]|jgi:DNA replication and repair protein RecF|nr:DNA replication/repair protein RecF [Oscillospiraceae bacterium]
MVLNGIELFAHRNYAEFRAEFSPGVNVICGKNAQGKTNLLEAICILAFGHSHRYARERDIIGADAEFSEIRARVTSNGRENTLETRLFRSAKRTVTRNGVKLATAGEAAGTLTAVMFDPSDLDLVRGAPENRRRELDAIIAQLRPRYADALTEFRRLYAGKLKILRDAAEKPTLLDAIDEYNHGLIETGARLIFYRASFVKKLAERAREQHRDCSGGAEDLEIIYLTERGVDTEVSDDAPAEIRKIAAALAARQREHREHEIASGKCLTGAQRDDLELKINGTSARTFASQGQARTCALALKLAERDLIAEDTGEAPVLLLDDVLSELDESRRAFVLGRISGGQVLITTCEPGEIPIADGGRILEIHAGRLVGCT